MVCCEHDDGVLCVLVELWFVSFYGNTPPTHTHTHQLFFDELAGFETNSPGRVSRNTVPLATSMSLLDSTLQTIIYILYVKTFCFIVCFLVREQPLHVRLQANILFWAAEAIVESANCCGGGRLDQEGTYGTSRGVVAIYLHFHHRIFSTRARLKVCTS